MRNLGINAKVNPFVFEHFRQRRLLKESEPDAYEPSSGEQSSESGGTKAVRAFHHRRESSIAAIKQIEESKRTHRESGQPVPKNDLFTPTLTLLADTHIEGYLVKAIETKRMI